MVLSNLALLLQETNRLAEAEPLHRRALAMAEQSRGPEHPDVALALNNVATLLHAMKRLAEAEPLLCRAVKILLGFMASTRHQHPNLQSFTENYIELLIQMGRSQSEVQAHLNVIGKPFGIQLGGGA